MTLKSSYELLIKSYEQFQVFWNLVKNRPHILRAPFGVQRTIYTHDRLAIVLCGWAEKSKKSQNASKTLHSRLMSNLIIFRIRIMCRKTIQLGLPCNWVSQAEKITKKNLDVTNILRSPFGVQRLSIYTTRRSAPSFSNF